MHGHVYKRQLTAACCTAQAAQLALFGDLGGGTVVVGRRPTREGTYVYTDVIHFRVSRNQHSMTTQLYLNK